MCFKCHILLTYCQIQITYSSMHCFDLLHLNILGVVIMEVMMMNLRMKMILMSGLSLFPLELEHRFAELKFPNCTNQTQLSTAQSSSSPPCWCSSAPPSSPSPSPSPSPSSPSCWCPSAPNCCCLSSGS